MDCAVSCGSLAEGIVILINEKNVFLNIHMFLALQLSSHHKPTDGIHEACPCMVTAVTVLSERLLIAEKPNKWKPDQVRKKDNIFLHTKFNYLVLNNI